MLLSIVICNHNYECFVDAAIASAVGQNYPDKEIIVIDDGSTDGSRDVISRWDGQIKAFFQSNQGQVAAYNRGFREARGEVIIYLDSDDALDPSAGSRVVAALADPDVVKVHYKLRLVDPNGQPLGPTIPRRLAEGDLRDVLTKRGMLYDSAPGSGNAYRRTTLARLMPLPDSATDRHGADFFTILGVSLLGKIQALGPEPLGSYRLHTNEARDGTTFGNAGLREPSKTQLRYVRLREWITERLGPSYQLPPHFIDFSTQKHVFVETVFEASGYLDGVRLGARVIGSELLRSIWRRPGSVFERLGLSGWALAVLLLPREVGRPIARYVCNPASRTVEI